MSLYRQMLGIRFAIPKQQQLEQLVQEQQQQRVQERTQTETTDRRECTRHRTSSILRKQQ